MRAVAPVELATPEEVGLSGPRLARIDATLARAVAEESLPEAVTLVARRGKVVHLSAIGPVERDAIFRIYSMTKPITCVAALMLFEEGRFLLDDPIAEFLPEFASAKVIAGDGVEDAERPISIRHLFMHTSGIAYDFTAVPALARMYAKEQIGERDEPLADFSRRLAALPLNHQPGARWTYGMSHDVLGRLVEVISGKTFDVFLRERIFAPLAMTETGFDAADSARVPPVFGVREGGGLERLDRPEYESSRRPVLFKGGGGLLATTSDYARFCQMLLNGGELGGQRLVGRKTVELMTTNLTGPSSPLPTEWPADWSMLAYGFGLGVRVLIDPSRSNSGGSIGEYGWAGALSTYFWVDPSEELFGVFMTQLEAPQFRYGRMVQALTYQALI